MANLNQIDIVEIIIAIVFLVFSIIMSIEDLRTKTVSRKLSVSLMILMLFLPLINLLRYGLSVPACRDYFLKPWIGFVFAFIIFFLVRQISKKKLGLADVFFSASIGALLGSRLYILAMLSACIFALMFYFGMFLTMGTRVKKISLPFIPFMTLSALVSYALKIFCF